VTAEPANDTPIDPDAILRQPFTTVRKGYDPLEVQKYLMSLAGELRAGRDRVRELERRVADATTRADALEHMSSERLTAMLGEETAKVIEAANRAAADIRTKAEENVARLLRDAQERAGRLQREAESVLEQKTKEAEEAVAAIRSQGDEVLQRARADAEVAVEAGRQRGSELVTEAQRVRERTLRDLVRRRKTLREQIEQLQAGRDRLIEAFLVVRGTVDVATEELEIVLPEAKAAADSALQRAVEEGDHALQEELATLTAEVDAAVAEGTRANEPTTSAEQATVDAPANATSSNGTADDEHGEGALAVPPEGAEHDDGDPDGARRYGPRARDPIAGRHSSAVKVIVPPSGPHGDAEAESLGSAGRVATLFARIRAEATGDDAHGEAASRLIPTEGTEAADQGAAAELADLPLDERSARVLAELERSLARRLKRELSDEQNEMLDAVRRGGTASLSAVIPDPEAHVERFASAAYAPLSDAAVAGGQLLPGHARTAGDAPRVGALAREVAADLAAELVAPLRDRLEVCFASASEGDEDGLSDALRACYREWRTQRVDDATGDAVVAALNRGVLVAVRPGVPLLWHLDGAATGCDRCGQNATAGRTPAGDPFPTGDHSPPIHSGCRCVLVVDGS
jgi:hypothetical protein